MAQQDSQVLGKALGTTFPTPNQLGAYPGGSVPPVAAPAAAPAPAPAQSQKTDEALSRVTSAMGSQDVGALRTAQGQAMQQAGELTGLAAMRKSENEIQDATRNAERARKEAEQVKTLEAQREAKTGEYKAFAPTQESVKDLGMLFGLVSVAAFSSGGEGRYSGMAAMKNMSAAMQGYREGRNDIFNKELKEYDKNMAALKANNDLAQKTFDNAMKLMAVDKDAGMAEIKRLAAIDNNGMVALLVNAGRFDEAGKILGHTADALAKEQEKRIALEEKATRDAEAIRHNREMEKLAGQRINLTIANQGAKASAKEAQIPDAVNYVKKFTGGVVSKTTAPEILIQAGALGDAYGLKAEIEKHPEYVGRTGQIKNIFNRTIESLNTGTALPDDNNQPELIFAKRYAEYLVNYERSLAGGAKGFTVAFQNRFNKLLEQNQFNAAGFGALMDEQMRTITSKASATSPSVNKKNLTEMALDIKTRAEDYDTADAIRAYSSGQSIAAPKDSDKTIPTVSSKEQYDALPPNALYMEDGKQYRKPK
jgi:hypothetical protein